MTKPISRAERDPAKLRERLAAWLATRLPHANDLTLSGLERPQGTGFSNESWVFELAWSADGDRWQERHVLRLEPGPERVFPSYDLKRQFSIQRGLWRTDVPVPRMVWLETDPAPLGAPFYVMEHVAGEIPRDDPSYHERGFPAELAPEARAEVWWSGLEMLARIHTLALGEQWRLRFLLEEAEAANAAGQRPIERALARWSEQLIWAARGRPQPTCETALAMLRATLPPGPDPPALCWGDARLGNQIFRDGRCVACLDWEMAEIGNPTQDLGWWLALDRHHHEMRGLPRLEGLPSREATIERWQERTGLEARGLAWYEAWAVFRFAVVMIRVAQGLVTAGLLPEHSPFEHDNTATRLLAKMLDLPPPDAP